MPTPQYTALANITLSSSAASVTFSSINGTYRDLMLVINAGTTSSDNALIQVNGTTTGYSSVFALGYSTSTVSSSSDTSGTQWYIKWGGATPNTVAWSAICNIMDYSATDKHKTMIHRDGNVLTDIEMGAHRWANTAAITSIAIKAAASTWLAGSTFALYGVK